MTTHHSRPARFRIGALYLLFSLCATLPSSAQGPVAASVPDSLKEQAYSVVRDARTTYTWHSPVSGEESNSLTITILNERGKDHADFVFYGDKFRELRKFSGEVYDARGKLIRKIRKSDLRFSEYSPHLASDDSYYRYECLLPSYPCTVRYEWEVRHKNGLIGFPGFFPQKTYNQSVEQASYTLYIPDATPFRYKAFRLREPAKDHNGKLPAHTWRAAGIQAIEHEPFAPPLSALTPLLLLSPENFVFDGQPGSLESWESYGAFQYALLHKRDELPPAARQKAQELTAGAANDREKVRRIYEYLGETTRYVSIQLGIGGFQPLPAAEVFRTGFGDCKALTNYAQALLREAGIPSFYTEISTNNRDLLPDYPSANQTNHVILQVPLPQDTLWLECTNTRYAPGYIHSSIAGHQALVIRQGKGQVVRLPTRPDSLHTQHQDIQLTLAPDGAVSAQVETTSRLSRYEDWLYFEKLSPSAQTDRLRKHIHLTQASVGAISYEEKKEADPAFILRYSFTSPLYGNRTGNRLFVPLNPLRGGFGKLPVKPRRQEIYIRQGYNDTDHLTLQLPEGYSVESVPPSVQLRTPFGTLTSEVKATGNTLTVRQEVSVRSGRYEAEKYPELILFLNSITACYQGKIILKKE